MSKKARRRSKNGEHMTESRQSVAQTLEEVITRRPALASILKGLEPLLTVQEGLVPELTIQLAKAQIELPEVSPQRFSQGVSLFSTYGFENLASPIRKSASVLIPMLTSFPAVAPFKDELETLLGAVSGEEPDGIRLQDLLRAFAAQDDTSVKKAAENAGIAPPVLSFALSFIFSPLLRALRKRIQGEAAVTPWDENDTWQQGYCPVCGALPSIAWLERPSNDPRNPYLTSGGGKKHLHCGICGADWRFHRGKCPACGAEGDKLVEILREKTGAFGERIDWCTKCRAYCPTVDMRERETTPNLDALALGMFHLDMIASKKGLKPLRTTFWNTFS